MKSKSQLKPIDLIGIFKVAAEICKEYGSMMGDRTCQDVTPEIAALIDQLDPSVLDEIYRQFEEINSNGKDYQPGDFAKHDGLSVGLAIGYFLENLAKDGEEQEGLK